MSDPTSVATPTEADAESPRKRERRWKRWLKRLAVTVAVLLILGVVLVYTVPRWITGDSYETFTLDNATPIKVVDENDDPTLTVMTANIAHGRGTGRHQMWLSKETIVGNLDKVADVFQRERPDVIALQEADGPSIWSGRFNHVEYLAGKAGCRHGLRGKHVDGLGLSYGAAILSCLPLRDPMSVTFAPSPPTMSKGFVAARVAWPGRPATSVTLVSVHLDFAKAEVRSQQIATMIDQLADAKRPLIVLGDFNCGWNDDESSLRHLAEKLKLRCFQPEARDMASFPDSGQRIDWILISGDLEFVTHKTLDDPVSDHRFVTATIRIKRTASTNQEDRARP